MIPGEYSGVALMEATGWTEKELDETSIETVDKMRSYLWARSYVQAGTEPEWETPEQLAEVSDMTPEQIAQAPEWVRRELARQSQLAEAVDDD